MSQNENKNKDEEKDSNLSVHNLDYEKETQLFGDIAQEWADKISKERGRSSQKNKISQLRAFYDKVYDLNEKAEGLNDEKYKKSIYPFVVMLNSKVKYAKTRNLVTDSFVKMINECVKSCENSSDKLNNFKLFFEAVIGFYPKK
ncbi:type III-A CRISPR-associated protein Csm2 [Malaciobacter molluscorum LMG 25693]|uniref:CRISPR system Cms protein Csm2 n=1 Tax=Malaciobacter molluscorum LMG 25693 TaxID=870501 RepID=A0A2G1DJ33_9BACT|nr:type III-A CRISPR-associated protein Csm2 [Malaciobacter molluscorum]AXX91681.1 CRISPR/Cas system-associated protein Csm2, type III-A [Malaciobacter molluscorum LMG 25693]PHO18523.1 type III-A CRISPR-associated protein Csm2 [Malaciobacter molluscorum LMG 25693]